MNNSGLMKGVNLAGEWAIKLAYANILWIFFTLLGLGLFGIMPATTGLFTLLRKGIMGEDHEPALRIFWKTYRREFIPSNLIGLLFFAVGFILKMDMGFLRMQSNSVYQILFIIVMCVSILYFVTLLNFFPVYVHFKVSFLQQLKYAFLIGMTQISSTIMMGVGAVFIFCLYWYISGLIPLFCMSLFAMNIMWFGFRSFKRIEMKQAEMMKSKEN